MTNHKSQMTNHKSQITQKGSVLIVLILTIMLLATLGAAMVYLNSTSAYNELNYNNSNKASYLAESGKRCIEGGVLSANTYMLTNGDKFTIDSTDTVTGNVREGTSFEAIRKVSY